MGQTTDKGGVTDARRSLGDTMFSTRVGHQGESGENTGGTITGSYCRNLINMPLAYFRGMGGDVGCGKGRGGGQPSE